MKNVCRNCGSEFVNVKDGKMYCQSCGAVLDVTPIEKPENSNPESPLKFELMFKQTVSITTIINDTMKAGTAFFISSKYALTNAHVLIDDGVLADSIVGKNYGRTKTFEFEIVDYDEELDIALIESTNISSMNFCVLSELINNGDPVYALGNSNGEGLCIANGIVSDKNRMVKGAEYIMCSALVTNGNSGGPLYSARGFVIGMITMCTPDAAMMNYAIPSKTINTFVDKVVATKNIKLH